MLAMKSCLKWIARLQLNNSTTEIRSCIKIMISGLVTWPNQAILQTQSKRYIREHTLLMKITVEVETVHLK